MSANFYSEDIAIDTVLQAAQSLHNEFLSKMRNLQHYTAETIAQGQDPSLEQLATQFQAMSEIMYVEVDTEAKYNEALRMCNNPTDLMYLHAFTKERQKEKMGLLAQIMENEVAKIASNDKLANEMKGFINNIRGFDCPQCRVEFGGDSDQELCDVVAVENPDILTATASNEEVAENFVRLLADLCCKKL